VRALHGSDSEVAEEGEAVQRGKEGGARVITYLFLENKNIYLLTIYDKSEKSDLQIGELKEMINSLSFE